MTAADLDDAKTVLLVASGVEDVGLEVCADMLAETPGTLDRLLVVPVGSTPADWEPQIAMRPSIADTAVSYVDVRTAVRSSPAEDVEGLPVTATISSPADLPALGTALNEALARAADEGERVGVCIHSVSDMLRFLDREFLFKFLHTLSARVRSVDGVVYYHLDADTGDEVRTLFSHLCEAVVVVDEGGVTVSPGYYAFADGSTD